MRNSQTSHFFLLSVILAISCTACTIISDKKTDGKSDAGPEVLEPAAEVFGFNLLAFTSIDLQSSATQGRVAVGGNAQLSDYSIGGVLAEDKTRCDLSVGGDLEFKKGSVYHGLICVVGAINTELVGTKFPGTSEVATDFAALKLAATTLATKLADLSADLKLDDKYLNGARGALILKGTDPRLNVFEFSAALVSSASSIEVSQPRGASAVVKVHGETVNLTDMGVIPTGSGEERIIFVFPDATSLTLTRTNFLGSILAPLADMRFNEGTINGSVVVRTAIGDARFNHRPYGGVLDRAEI
jgi:choice-of-anchor A domain-containing protein